MDTIPSRPAGLKLLPKGCLKLLKKNKLCTLAPAQLNLLMSGRYLQQAKSTHRRGPFHLSDNGSIAFLCWKVARPPFTQLLNSTSWESIAGYIRDQLYHIICWAYCSADLTSAIRIIRHWVNSYVPLCAWYLSANVDPAMLGMDIDAEEGHMCYGCSLDEAFGHIKIHGIPEELPQYRAFNCCRSPPSSNNRKHKIKSFLSFDTLDKALAHLHIQPIGAALIVFPELWRAGDYIYRGPMLAEDSNCLGYHDVMIVRVEMFEGEQVALCKMSNGRKVASGGYVRVSLEVLYMVVGAEAKAGEVLRPTPTPKHLLSDFHCPEMDEAPRRNPKRKRKGKQHHGPNRSKRSRGQRGALSRSTLHRQLINTKDTDSHDQEKSLQLSFGSSPLSNVAPQMEHSDASGQSMRSSNSSNASSSGSRSISMPVALQGSGINEECPRLQD